MIKSQKSLPELEIEQLLSNYKELINNSVLTIKDSEKMLYMGEKLLAQCERLRVSRDKWKTKYYNLKNGI